MTKMQLLLLRLKFVTARGAWFESGGSDVSAAGQIWGQDTNLLMGGIRAERRAAAEIYFFENGALKENIY